MMYLFGVGDHGGGPTRKDLDIGLRWAKKDVVFPELHFDTAGNYFAELQKNESELKIPTWDDELYLEYHRGVQTTQAEEKKHNRKSEVLILNAEKLAAIDTLFGASYPHAQFERAWKNILFNQFHDILAGTSLRSAYEDARDDYGRARSIAAEVFNRAVQAVARRIDIPLRDGTVPLVVFNPHPWELEQDVEVEFGQAAAVRLTDDQDRPVAVQLTRSEATVNGNRGRLAFRASVPPLGHRVYHLLPGADASAEGPVTATADTLENEHLRLRVDPQTGWLSSLVDKATGEELIPADPGPHAVVVDDASDTWGHRIRAYGKAVGAFGATRVRLVESGPVRAVLRIESRYGNSAMAEELVLSAGARHVEVRTAVDWHEKLKLLKLRFPTALEEVTATHEIPYGHLERTPDGTEEPTPAWVDVTGTLPGGGRAGLTVVNDSKHGHDVTGGEIGMTALRSPVYAWHEPKVLDEDGVYDHLDQGRQEFRYLLLPHGADWRAADPARRAAELNQPSFALLETFHAGPIAQCAANADDGAGSVLVTVVKGDEDDSGDVIVRGYESQGTATRARIALPMLGEGRVIEAEFGAHEIKTFRVPADPAAPVVETDLLELPSSTAPATADAAAVAAGPAGEGA
jgi:alpha-mannosidase